MFYDKYPYTDFHELNLDWIISTTSDMKKSVDYLLEEFAKIKVLTKEEIQAMIDASCNEVKAYSDLKDAQLKAELEGQISASYEQITNEYKSFVNSKVSNLKIYVDAQDVATLNNANGYTDERETVIRQYVDDKFIDYMYMFNAFRGVVTDVRVVVQDIIDNGFRTDSLTAGDYDALNLTAGAYDAYNITAYNYDFHAKSMLV